MASNMKTAYLALAWLSAIAIASGGLSLVTGFAVFAVLLLSSLAWLRQHAISKGGWDQVSPAGALVGGFLIAVIPIVIGFVSLFFYLWRTTGFAD